MAGIVRKIHPTTNFVFGEASKMVPDAKMTATDNITGLDVETFALVMIDPDGEAHVYPMTIEGKQNLLAILTGGVVVPQNGSMH